ncbi:hypothetical protein KJ966_26195 [bacterium]|nr:hypothetical protein [bacterium]
MATENVLKGNCHCGNISLEFRTKLSTPDFSVRKCDCSYCTKMGSRYISDPNGELTIKYKDENQVSKYSFGTKTASFLICMNCGVMPVAVCSLDGQDFGIVNVNSLEDADHFGRHSKLMSYDGESLGERLARRKRNWIAKVIYTDD